MSKSFRSLLSFLDAPIVVGDPDGRTVYVNQAFEAHFRMPRKPLIGAPLAMLFEGGGREAVLKAVAQVCSEGRSVRLRLRERGVGFAAIVSPITAEGSRVGVVLLLLEDVLEEERLLAYQREIQGPLEEVAHCLEELFDQTGGRRYEGHRDQLETALRAVDRLRKWTEELRVAVTGQSRAESGSGRFDPAQPVRDAAASVAREAALARREIEVLVPAQLPEVAGDRARLEAALASLLRDRLKHSPASSLTLAAKTVGQGERAAVLVLLTELSPSEGSAEPAPFTPPPLVAEIVRSLGGSLTTTDDPVLGRTTAIRLSVAS